MEKAGIGSAPSPGIALPPWVARVWEGAFSMTGYVVNEVRRGDPICVTLMLFLAFFAVVCLSYFQYRNTPRSIAKKAGKSRSRAKKKGAVVEPSDAVQSTAADGTGVPKKQRKPGQAGTSSSVQTASPTAHANVPLAVENEPTDNDDGGGEWKVVTSRRGKKKEN